MFFSRRKNEDWISHLGRIVPHVISGFGVAIVFFFTSLLPILSKQIINYTVFDLIGIVFWTITIFIWIYFALGGYE